MLLDVQTIPAATSRRAPDREAAARRSFGWARPAGPRHPAPRADGNAVQRVVLRRGPKMMVLFRGRPCPKETGALRQAGVTIGLALSSGELPAVPSLDEYGYVFVSSRRRTRSTLGEAVADLERNSWSVEVQPVKAADRPRPARGMDAARRMISAAADFIDPVPAFR